MGFNLGNAIKYIWRAGIKTEDAERDLRKAIWYIEDEIAKSKVSGNPRIAGVWADMGATAPSGGWGSNSSVIAGFNTTTSAVNAFIDVEGDATYAFEITGAGGSNASIATPGGTTASGTLRTLQVLIDNVALRILCAATYS